MKRSLFFVLIFSIFNLVAIAQSKDNKPNQITLTKDSTEVIGMKKISDISAEVLQLNRSMSKLKKEAREKIEKKASEIGATVVLIREESVTIYPIRLFVINGTAYRK
jgi:cell division protein FtsB